MFYREWEHNGKIPDAASLIDIFRYIMHYICKNAKNNALVLHFKHAMIKSNITNLQMG